MDFAVLAWIDRPVAEVARCPDREPDEDDGTYTLSVPNLPGSSVSGSSLSEAESALSVRIDTLV
jgi:hypothetical protein